MFPAMIGDLPERVSPLDVFLLEGLASGWTPMSKLQQAPGISRQYLASDFRPGEQPAQSGQCLGTLALRPTPILVITVGSK